MSSREELLAALRDGQAALLSVDTIVGLHQSSLAQGAPQALRSLKGSAVDRPFLLLFSSTEDALGHGSPHAAHEAALRRAWPGPLTALLTPTGAAPTAWSEPSGLLAARVPALVELRRLITDLGAPLWSTSANLSGAPAAADLDAARAQFPDLVWADFSVEGGGSQASTLVDLSGPEARILRPGAAVWPPP
jgi:L-threonylcarbamoyladenylate synthase